MKCYYHPDRDVVGQCSRCGKFACRECIEDVGGAMLCTGCQRLAKAEMVTETHQAAEKARKRIYVAYIFGLVGAFAGLLMGLEAETWEIAVVATPGLAYLGWGLAWGWPPVWRRWSDILGGWCIYGGEPFVWTMTLLFWFVPLSIAIGYGCLGGGIKLYAHARTEMQAARGQGTNFEIEEVRMSLVVAFMFALAGAILGGLIALDEGSWVLGVMTTPGIAYLGWGLYWGWPPVWRKWSDTLIGWSTYGRQFMWAMTLLFWIIPLSIAIGYGCLGGGIKRYLRARAMVRVLGWESTVDEAREAAEEILSAGHNEEALTALERLLVVAPNDAGLWSGRGAALSTLGRYEEALASCDRSLTLAPNLGAAWHNKSGTLFELHRYQEALDASERAVTLEPENAIVWVGEGAALNELRLSDEAMAAFDRALTLDPNLDEAWYGKALAFSSLGRDEEAVAAYDHVLAINPTWDKAQRGKAEALEKLARARTPDAAAHA